jgi:TonB family protein
MNPHDEEFEIFLRQFQPSRPKALPQERHATTLLAVAALVVAAVVVPLRFAYRGNAGSAPQPAMPAASSTSGSPDRSGELGSPTEIPRAAPMPRDLERNTILIPRRQPSRSAARQPSASASPAAGRRVKVGGAVSAPRKIVDVKPVYPEEAKAAGIEGIVILGIVIGEDGSVIDAQVLRSIPELDQAAIDAVTGWQFEPTLLNGEPVEVEMAVTVNFTLR